MKIKVSVANLQKFVQEHSVEYRNKSLGLNLTQHDFIEVNETTMEDVANMKRKEEEEKAAGVKYDNNPDIPENPQEYEDLDKNSTDTHKKDDLRLRSLNLRIDS